MGKASAPDTPDYVGAAQATANTNKYNTSSPYGGTNWTVNPNADPNNPQPGDYTQSTTLDPSQQRLFDQNNDLRYGTGMAAQSALNDMQGGSKGFQDALYGKQTQYYDQRFGNDQNALQSQLANQGVAPGSAAYQQAMQTFDQNKNQAYDTATMNSITGADQAQNNAVARLAQLIGTSGPQMPGGGGMGGGADILSALSQQYAGQLGAVNANNAAAGQLGSEGMGLASMGLMAYLLPLLAA